MPILEATKPPAEDVSTFSIFEEYCVSLDLFETRTKCGGLGHKKGLRNPEFSVQPFSIVSGNSQRDLCLNLLWFNDSGILTLFEE